ncbi:hypothetical protein [Caulobacter sp. LjRoot300]|uniref:rhamnogalacturonan lyase family protein n=1 Tax=Caulobacter sp. LjRoot300 TaxID=3342321 RepID=UPI003ECCF07E
MSKRGENRGAVTALLCATALSSAITLMHDPQYRAAIAWRNTAYNQPPHTSFYLGEGMKAPPRPDIRTQ